MKLLDYYFWDYELLFDRFKSSKECIFEIIRVAL